MKILKILLLSIMSILSIIGIIFIGLIIHYWPVIDRVYIQPCTYYPHAFIDCKEAS